jgi:hypothetical protein
LKDQAGSKKPELPKDGSKLQSCSSGIREADKSFKRLGRLGAQSWVRKSNEEQK